MNLEGRRVIVLGLGKSGLAAARLACARGATVLATDRKSEAELGAVAAQLLAAGVELRLGEAHRPTVVEGADLLVVSPGVPPNDIVAEAEAHAVPVVGEIELSSWFLSAPVVAITGTNGKSTVTSLVGEMLAASGFPTFTGGNLGVALAEAVGTPAGEAGGRIVCEVSSYQLERIERFRAHVGVLLNVTPDHLDRYPTFAAYAGAKGNLFTTQLRSDHAVVPAGDALCAEQAARGPAAVSRFGRDASADVEVLADAIVDHVDGSRYPLAELRLRGGHNVLNAAAAILAARLAGAGAEPMRAVLASFEGLPHRMRLVTRSEGVDWYDDSKATNVAAAVAAIEGLDRTVVLIAGGVDKGGSYAPLVERLRERARAVVTLGEAAAKIEDALGDLVPYQRVASMAEAVRVAGELARPGDAVLLAPACASFDMFANYAARGEAFAAAARARSAGGVS